MKYFVLALFGICFLSCDNELDLIAESREVPVVYGLLDQSDTAQYIRVERVFVDKEIEPKVISQNPDSLYYKGITVKLVKVGSGQEYILERVDGNLEGYEREDGVFADSPNYLYKILAEDIPLNEYDEIELNIEGIFEDKAVTSTTTILEPPFLLNPKDGGLVNFQPNRSINIGWTPKGGVEVFTVIFYFNITEFKLGAPTTKRLTWVVDANTSKSTVEADGNDFYSFLSGALTVDELTSRSLNSIEFELISGGQSIQEYISVGQANLGITSSGEIPILTNINDGLGVFGATHTHRRVGLSLTAASRDSLLNSSITSNLNFQ